MSFASASAFWMRRSTSRTVSRYWSTRGDPPGRAGLCSRAISSVTESSRLARFFERRPPVGGAPPFAEQALEDDPRVGLGRQRRRRRRPREIVLIDAGVAVVALADGREQVHRHSSDGSCVSWPICLAAI